MTINSNDELKSVLAYEEKVYFGSKGVTAEHKYRKPFKYEMLRYLTLLRKYEFLLSQEKNTSGVLKKKALSLKIKNCDRKKNMLGLKLSVEIPPEHTGKGLKICHPGVILNGFVGDNCIFHGNNVLGNKRTCDTDAVPHLGNNVDVGVGAMIIGSVEIADNCVIGAGAVVTKSFTVPGSVIAGVPAKRTDR